MAGSSFRPVRTHHDCIGELGELGGGKDPRTATVMTRERVSKVGDEMSEEAEDRSCEGRAGKALTAALWSGARK